MFKFFLLVILLQPFFSISDPNGCLKVFSKKDTDLDSLNYKLFKGHNGYIYLSSKYFNGDMLKTFKAVSTILGQEHFQQLGWKVFHGTTKDFKLLRSLILDRKGNTYIKYRGTNGYTLFSSKYFQSNMNKAFTKVSNVLDKEQFQQLGWKAFNGTLENFKALNSLILDENGNALIKYHGTNGYILFSNEHFQGNMLKTFTNVSATLNKKQLQQLEWKGFNGTVEEFRALSSLILDENGNALIKYRGTNGYILFSNEHFQGNMLKTFTNVSAVLNKKQFQQLEWKGFNGTVEEFKALNSLILGGNGNALIKYHGTNGYILFSKEHFQGDMIKTFKAVSAVLDKKQFQQLEWKAFHGKIKNFKALSSLILDKNGNTLIKYHGTNGYILFSKEYFQGNMLKTFANVSATLNKEQFQQLGWKSFHGTVEEFRTLSSLILDKNGNTLIKYRGIKGYSLFSSRYFQGNMFKTFKAISTVLNKEQFQQLGWRSFDGTAKEFKALSSLILDDNGNTLIKYRGANGYALFFSDHFQGNMHKAFINISTVLNKEQFQQLGWKSFNGTVEEFRALSSLILDDNGNTLIKYRGANGYALFSTEHFQGNMLKTFTNVSSVLDKEQFQQLEWKSFKGKAKEFKTLSSLILDDSGNTLIKYRKMNGYALFSTEHFQGDMIKTFTNVSAVLNKKQFQQLEWKNFNGTAEEFRALSSLILDKNGDALTKYHGMDGYALFSKEYFQGNMVKTFTNVSTVLDKETMKSLDWKTFRGTHLQYETLIKIFRETSLLDLRYLKGQRKVATKVFKGDMKLTYKNVSALRSYLFTDPKIFNILEWKK